jgi:hypothetical protein
MEFPMNKKLLKTLGLVVVLLVAYLVLSDRTPEKEPGASWSFPEISTLDRIELNRNGESISAELNDSGWRLLSPVDFSANTQQMDSVERLFSNPESPLIVDNEKPATDENLSRYGLDQETAFTVTVFDGGEPTSTLTLGRNDEMENRPSRTWVHPEGLDTIYRFNQDLLRVLDKETVDWRNKDVIRLADEEKDLLFAMDISYGERRLTLQRDVSEEGDWYASAPEGMAVDSHLVENFVRSISAVRAQDFADDATPEETGLDLPQHTITLHTDEATEYTLQFGQSTAEAPEDENGPYRYVRLNEGPVYLLRGSSADRLMKRLGDFMPTSVLDNELDSVMALTLRDSGGDRITLDRNNDEEDVDRWSMRQPRRLNAVNETQMQRLLSNVADLDAGRFADEEVDASLAGLAPAGRQITVTMADGSEHVIELGAPVTPPEAGDSHEDVDRFARVDGGPIFELRGYKARVLLTTTEQLTPEEED